MLLKTTVCTMYVLCTSTYYYYILSHSSRGLVPRAPSGEPWVLERLLARDAPFGVDRKHL